jgi:phosphohistidine phosphatase
MRLLLIRHADAGDRDVALWPDDTQRPVSENGRRTHRRVARRLKRRGLAPSLLLSSPWLRAWQTAQLTARHAGGAAPLPCPELAGAPDLPAIQAAMGHPDADAIVGLIGHEPWLGELGAILLVGEPHRLSIDFPKSGVLGLGCDDLTVGGATLEFLWRPKRS